MKIERIVGREIFDSRGFPTVACDLMLNDGSWFHSSVPSGASCSKYEAVELRDGGARLMGKGVRNAVEKLETLIAPVLIGKDPDLVSIDARMRELDGTDNCAHLGANSMLAVSIAVCKAQASVEMMNLYEHIMQLCGFECVSMPSPMFNIINGGVHADNNLSIQEIMIVPKDVDTFSEAMDFGVTIFHILKQILKERGKPVTVGDEGGFAPNFSDTSEALDCVQEAIVRAQKECKGDAAISLDVAASQLYDARTKRYAIDGKQLTTSELLAWYMMLIEKYDIYSIEDGIQEDDWDGWRKMDDLFAEKILLVGDDIFATNPERIYQGIEKEIANAVLIKPNQIGTVTETLQAVKLCEDEGLTTIVSHRSGETNDTFIADLAVGVSAQHIKAGGCSRGERMAKYNRLLTIERELLASFERL